MQSSLSQLTGSNTHSQVGTKAHANDRANDIRICIKGAGDLATGVAVRLYLSGFRRILMLEIEAPLAVRRTVAFSEAVYKGEQTVSGIRAVSVKRLDQLKTAWEAGHIAVMVDPQAKVPRQLSLQVIVDAIIAKTNLGTKITDAPMVIGLGPGFTAGFDVHRVIETQRGDHLANIIRSGQAQANTGIPGPVMGYGKERVLHAHQAGCFVTDLTIGDVVKKKQAVGHISGEPVFAGVDGLIRGLLRSNTVVKQGTKLGDIDPRNDASLLRCISDKAEALGESLVKVVLEEQSNLKNGRTLWQ